MIIGKFSVHEFLRRKLATRLINFGINLKRVSLVKYLGKTVKLESVRQRKEISSIWALRVPDYTIFF